MNIDSNFTDLLKDNNVRYILQKIHDELKTSKADKPHIATKVPSFTGKVELFNQDIPEENDSYFIRCLNDNDIITNINFEVRYPNKNKNDIDYSLLNSPEEFKTPYVSLTFDVLDKHFLNKIYEGAIDAMVINPYPLETQKNLVYSAIVKIKAQTQKDDFILSWKEINEEDRPHIEIQKTLNGLKADKKIEISNFKSNLALPTGYDNTDFKAQVLYTLVVPFTNKNYLSCPPMILDQDTRKVFYPNLKTKTNITSFREVDKNYRVLEAFFNAKKNYILTYPEIYLLIYPNISRKSIPNRFDRSHKRKIEEVIKYLRDKFNNHGLLTYIQDSYQLTP